MAYNVDQIYGFLKWLIRKNQSGGISATDFFYAWNQEQSSYQSDLLGRWQARSNNKTGPNIGLIQDETVLTKLAPFTLNANLTITSGFSNWPTDLVYVMAITSNSRPVYHFNKDERAAIVDNVIDPPSLTDETYYYTEYGGQWEFLPSTLTAATLDYIKACTNIVWGYQLDGQNRQVYDPGASVQPLWDANSIIEITKRSLKSVGVSYKDADFSQFGNSNINSGD